MFASGEKWKPAKQEKEGREEGGPDALKEEKVEPVFGQEKEIRQVFMPWRGGERGRKKKKEKRAGLSGIIERVKWGSQGVLSTFERQGGKRSSIVFSLCVYVIGEKKRERNDCRRESDLNPNL